MEIKSQKYQIIWSNANCTVTLNLSPCLNKWLVTTTCKFMKTEYDCLEKAALDFEAGTNNSVKEVYKPKEAAA